MRVPFNYLQYEFQESKVILNNWKKLISSCDYTLGKYVEEVEKKFARYFNCKYVIAVNSGTDALILSLRALGIKRGDEVITAANTFYATAGAIVACGATPILVDVNNKYQIDVSKIEEKITSNTKAIIPVYWGGGIPEINKIKRISSKYKISIIEDACMGIGGKVGKKHPGTFGDIGCFSFHPLKTINAIGDAGMVCTNNQKLFEWMKMYRNHGMVDRDHIDIWGVNMRMQPLQCVVVLDGLKKIDKIIRKRNNNANYLDSKLKLLSKYVTIPDRKTNEKETYALYMIRAKDRNRLIKYLNSYDIEAKIHYPVPLCLQKPFLKYKKNNSYNNAISQSHEIITLPIHQYIEKKHLDYMFDKIKSFYLNI
ncbi:DegT/DnrJ/EryC1/StrS family aminotransferase [Alphaproteobacteria bacterium]|nr:DegT/DnrJ/EryC1/StrS family aminotransferase [Alphaproteobacteria bacterium]